MADESNTAGIDSQGLAVKMSEKSLGFAKISRHQRNQSSGTETIVRGSL